MRRPTWYRCCALSDEIRRPVRVLCRAKLNLWLRVLERRPDGYHTIQTVMCAVSLADDLRLRPAESGIRLLCDDPAVPPGDANLAVRAAKAYLEAAELRPEYPFGVALELHKRIPMQAGMGGGSSDAAGVLAGLNAMLSAPVDSAQLNAIAHSLGADVPFFLGPSGAVLIEGIGGQGTPIALPRFWAAIVKPAFGVSTIWAYEHCTPCGGPRGVEQLLAALEAGDLKRVGELMRNDLEPPVAQLHPEITAVRRQLLEAGALGAMMTGSGSAVFGLAESREAAERLAASAAAPSRATFVVSSVAPALEVRVE